MKKYIICGFTLLLCLNINSLFAWDEPINLGSVINSSTHDYSPCISYDGNTLYFSSRSSGYGNDDLFYSTKSGGSWQNPVNLGPVINSSTYEKDPAISSDGNTLYFTAYARSGGYGHDDIWVTQKIGGVWQEPENLGPAINSSENDRMPCISYDGNILYFSSERSGGQGSHDIYMSIKVGGVWQEATNPGSPINSSYNDTTPFLTRDGNYLYFVTRRPGGLGSDDIWVSQKMGGNWQTPEPLGSPVNSSLQEEYCSISSDGNDLYFTGWNRSGGYGGADIWLSSNVCSAPNAIFTGSPISGTAPLTVTFTD